MRQNYFGVKEWLRTHYSMLKLATQTDQMPGGWTPARLAHHASNGTWTCPPHLTLLNTKLLQLAAGHIRRLKVSMPPRHGKSELCSKYFPAWYLGNFPDRRIILSSYSDEFAEEWGRRSKDIVAEHGKPIFGIELNPATTAAARWELKGRSGGMVTAGVSGGAVTGKGAHLFVIDDPIKNAEEAASQTMRDKTWEWFQGTMYSRLEPGGVILLIMTRWHEDDIAGRLDEMQKSGGEKWETLNLPAIAEERDILGRSPGDALWPERYKIEDLRGIEQTIGPYFFAAQFQGRPRPKEGGMFKEIWVKNNVISRVPEYVTKRVRFWDKASTQDKGDWTAGCRMSRYGDIFYVEHMARVQKLSGGRDLFIKDMALHDLLSTGYCVIRTEQEPGGAGKDAGHAFVSMLKQYDVACRNISGDKEMRARPFASQLEVGNVKFVDGPWLKPFIEELIVFPKGKYDDQVDACSGAYNYLAGELDTEWGSNPTAGWRGRVEVK
jgi:predicted phage terminase large subunit-like protein